MVGTGNPLFFYIFYRFTNGILLRTRRKRKIKSRQGICTKSCISTWMISYSLEVSSSFPLGCGAVGFLGEQGISDLLLLLLCSFWSVLGIGTTTSLSSGPFPGWDLLQIIPAFCSFSHSGLEQQVLWQTSR